MSKALGTFALVTVLSALLMALSLAVARHGYPYGAYGVKRLDGIKDICAALRRDGRWNAEWYVVTEVIQVRAVRVVIGSQGGAELVIGLDAANTEVVAAAPWLALAAGNLQLKVSDNIDINARAEDATPLFRVLRVRNKLFGGDVWEPRWLSSPDDDEGEEEPG